MIKADLIIVHPDTVDFPLFRKFIHTDRKRFAEVFIVWTKTNWDMPSVKEFVEKDLKSYRITFVENDPINVEGQDWRDVATNKALGLSKSEWVWFWEPDFFPNSRFWGTFEQKFGPEFDIAYVHIQSRMHPCCMAIKRSVLSETSLDFSAKPPEYDHFGKIQLDLEQKTPPLRWFSFETSSYSHLGGLTHNMFLLQKGEDPIYMVDEFVKYLKNCLNAEVKLMPEFKEIVKWYLEDV